MLCSLSCWNYMWPYCHTHAACVLVHVLLLYYKSLNLTFAGILPTRESIHDFVLIIIIILFIFYFPWIYLHTAIIKWLWHGKLGHRRVYFLYWTAASQLAAEGQNGCDLTLCGVNAISEVFLSEWMWSAWCVRNACAYSTWVFGAVLACCADYILRLYATPAPPCRQTPTGVRNGVSKQNPKDQRINNKYYKSVDPRLRDTTEVSSTYNN